MERVTDNRGENVLGCSFWVDFLQVCEFDSFSPQDEFALFGENKDFSVVGVDLYIDCGLWEPIHSCISDCDYHLCPPVPRQSVHGGEPVPCGARFNERTGVSFRVWVVLV